jgi:hypothetical protein
MMMYGTAYFTGNKYLMSYILKVNQYLILTLLPRLDWQMWFAALGSYQHNPWFISLVYRLLKASQ